MNGRTARLIRSYALQIQKSATPVKKRWRFTFNHKQKAEERKFMERALSLPRSEAKFNEFHRHP